MSASPANGHVGGRLEGAVYAHDGLGLRYSGPEDWLARKVPDFSRHSSSLPPFSWQAKQRRCPAS